MVYLQLFIEFFKIGLFSVGGGMATLPFLVDLTTKYDWYTKAELSNMVAISQSTPGPIGVNMATYAGYNAAGISGAILATVALTVPALVIIVIIAKFMENFSENTVVKSAFYGIRPTVAALIGYAVWELLQITFLLTKNGKMQLDYLGILLCLVMFALMMVKPLKKLHPLCWIVAGAALGIVFQL
ncbi:MAG: chromate transporter [Hespellia sp.]|jgi:chromate transporter|nr:chromate transporter [Hespellia sp.]